MTGGTAPFTYRYSRRNPNGSYSTVGQSEDLNNAAAGWYRVSIRDANGCWSSIDSILVGGPYIDISAFNPSCGSPNNGSATVNVQGFTNPTFLWSNGATAATASNLSAGTYTVTVTDGGCTLTGSININGQGAFPIVYIVDSSFNCQQGDLTAFAYSGAGSGFTYAWSNGATTPQITVGPGRYIVTATDPNGCTAVDTAYVQSGPSQLGSSAVIQDATCGNSDGAIDLTVSGSYSNLQWIPNVGIGEDVTGLSAGRYVVNFYNYNQCLTGSDTFLVNPVHGLQYLLSALLKVM